MLSRTTIRAGLASIYLLTMTAQEYFQLVLDTGIHTSNNVIFDTEYALPTEDWFFGPFADAIRKMNWTLGLEYQPQSNDCDDYAERARALAQTCNALTPDRPIGKSLAVGLLTYLQNTEELKKHAIIFAAIRTADGKRKLVFMEPQDGTKVEMSVIDLMNVDLYII